MNPLLKKIKKICADEDYILLFDSGEGMDWGHPKVFPDGILLTAGNGQTIDGYASWFYKWEDISVVAHQGFSVTQITDKLLDTEKRKICHLKVANGEETINKKGGRPFLCAMGVHEMEDDNSDFDRPRRAWADQPRVCKACKKRTKVSQYFGDPLEISGEFFLVGSGLYVKQDHGAEAVIMPLTDIHEGV